MKKFLFLSAVIFVTLIFISRCKAPSEPAGGGDSTTTYTTYLTGYVVESSTGNAIVNSIIRAYYGEEQKGATSGADGSFTLELQLSTDTDVTLVASADGYNTDTTDVFAITGESITAPTFKLKQQEGGGGVQSGKPASIYLYSVSAANIAVAEAGALEAAQIVFQVIDSNGIAIDFDNSVTVAFTFGDHPNGGEYLYPDSVKTNTLGRASVTLNSGTKAGEVQVQASFVSEGSTFLAQPVLISIHGGLPDDTHFSIATGKLNIPAIEFKLYPSLITAFVGDKYANPVVPGTSVYFTTEGGFIEGSTLTDESGIGSVNFITAQPVNVSHPVYGPGFFTVTATTADENQNQISDDLIELFSFGPILFVSPTTFNIPNGGSASFDYTLMDFNGNPMSAGQTVSVKAEGGSAIVAGDASVTFPDTQSPAWTSFQFNITDGDDLVIKEEPVLVTVETTGPNGAAKFIFSGLIH